MYRTDGTTPACMCVASGCFSRRGFLGGTLALGGAALLPGSGLRAQAAATDVAKPHRIDVHHHFATPDWVAAVSGRERLNPRTRTWTPARSIEEMDRNGVAAGMLSITNPGLWFGDAAATQTLARACNDVAARLARDYPGRFGVFAAMPMPDAEASLREIEYAYDQLKCDGIGLFTSYADRWLGNAAFSPVFEELNRRRALVFVHPTAASCCGNLIAELPASMIEYGTDTTRAIGSLLATGTAARYPDIRYIFSHAGGTAPYLIYRLLRLEQTLPEQAQRLPHGVLHELRKFHYDVAGAAHPLPLSALLKLVPVSQVLFGTDYPSAGGIADVLKGLAECGFDAATMRAIERDNAIRLLPRLNA